MSRLGPAALLALVAAACSSKEPGPRPRFEGPEPAGVQSAELQTGKHAGPSPATRPSGFVATVKNPGTAYFAVEGIGVVRLRDGVFSVLPGVNGMVKALALGKEGLWVTNYSGLYVFRPGARAAEKLGDYANPGSIEQVAQGKDGVLWTLGYDGVRRFDHKDWKLFDAGKFGGARMVRGLAVDGESRAWVSTARGLFHDKGNDWVPGMVNSEDENAYFDKLLTAPDGTIFASVVDGLVRCAADGCRGHGKLKARPNAFAVAGDGRVLTVTALDRISILSPDQTETPISPEEAGFRANAVRVAAADAAGRFWLATDLGVVVLDREGTAVQWEPGQVKELSGTIHSIVLEGEGPNLPVLGPRARRAIKGRVLRGGVPVANAAVEICESPSLFFATPCVQASFKQTATTDDHGRFSLPDVPLGAYRFAIQTGGKWEITLGGDCCTTVTDGESYDIGSIALRE